MFDKKLEKKTERGWWLIHIWTARKCEIKADGKIESWNEYRADRRLVKDNGTPDDEWHDKLADKSAAVEYYEMLLDCGFAERDIH